jgi:hypothetical protein
MRSFDDRSVRLHPAPRLKIALFVAAANAIAQYPQKKVLIDISQ